MEDDESVADILYLDDYDSRVHKAHTIYMEDLTSVSPLVSDEDTPRSSRTVYRYERSDSPIFSMSGRRIPSALKRQGQSPHTPRKRVTFTIPDGSSPLRDQETDSEDYEIIPLQEKSSPLSSSNSFRNNTSPSLATTGLLSQKAPSIVVQDRLPSITREPAPEEKPAPTPVITSTATFKTLRTKLRGMAPVRIRKSLPASEPLKVCLHCKGSLISHSELKAIIDNAIHYFKDARVTCLQYDPLTVWSGDPAALNRWIISLSDMDACNYLTGTGLHIHGQYFNVVSYDDIAMEEHEVYKMKQGILQESKRKAFKAA